MRKIVDAVVVNLSGEEIRADAPKSFQGIILPLLISCVAWTAIIVPMVSAYRNVQNWVHLWLVILKGFSYSVFFLIILSCFTALLIRIKGKFRDSLYAGFLAGLPVVIVFLISLALNFHFKDVRIAGRFPEHPLIIAAYFTIFSHVKVIVAAGTRKRALAGLVVSTILVYILLGPLMFRLFSL